MRKPIEISTATNMTRKCELMMHNSLALIAQGAVERHVKGRPHVQPILNALTQFKEDAAAIGLDVEGRDFDQAIGIFANKAWSESDGSQAAQAQFNRMAIIREELRDVNYFRPNEKQA